MYDNLNTFNASYWDLIVPIGSTATLRMDLRVDFYGGVSGGGTLNLYVPYIRTTLFGSWSGFLGKVNVTTDSDGGNFRIANSSGYPKAAIYLGPKVRAYARLNATGTYPIGELSGDATSQLAGVIYDNITPGAYAATWSVRGRSTDAIFAGSIINGTSPNITALTKVGFGTWTLSGVCSYTGPTNVLAGTLRITGTGSSSSSLNAADGATLELARGAMTINGAAANYGTVRLTGSGSLQPSGTFTNFSVLDIMTSKQPLPTNFINQGTVFDSSSVKVEQLTLSSTAVQLTVQSYSGHNYQLQRSTSLVSGTWINIGSTQAGDDVLTFTDSTCPRGKGFYRIIVSP